MRISEIDRPANRAARWRGSAVVMAIVVAMASPAVAQPAPLDGFDAYVRTAMTAWQVPGLAVVVVKGDQVILARGYGVRDLRRPDPVDERTIFAIGSATKGFTATALGIMIDRGKLSLDDPVIRHLPGFELATPALTHEVRLRDLLTHRTGVAGGDLLWASGGFDRDEIVRRLRFVEPTWGLRERFDYSNIMYIAAGQVLAGVSGSTWDQAVRSTILEPLGMRESTTSIRDLPTNGNVATPHVPDPSGPIPVAWRNMDNTVAGGGINSTVSDLARWLRFQLANGRVDGRQLVSPGFLAETRRPQTVIQRDGAWALMSPDAHFMAYGIGWIMSDYHGRLLLQHGGGIDGMSAMVGLMPEENVGVAVLSNLDGNQLPASLMMRTFDAFLGRPARDWSGENLAATRAMEAAGLAEEKAREAAIVKGTAPSLGLDRYVGTYRHPAWGDAVVTLDRGVLHLEYGSEFEGDLEHLQYDAFRARWNKPARGTNFVNFTIDVRRQAVQLDIYLWLDATFTRVP